MEVLVQNFPVDILTPHYRVYGEIRTIGDPLIFLNDKNTQVLTIHDVVLLPLRKQVRLGSVSVDKFHIPVTEVHIISLGNYQPTITPLPKTEQLICFTDTFLLRGTFHMSVETRVQDVFWSSSGAFFAITNVDILSLYPLQADVQAYTTLGYVRGEKVRGFFNYQESVDNNLDAFWNDVPRPHIR